MTATIIDEYIRPVLIRYIDRYHWNWNTSTRIINLYYGTAYTKRELQALYRSGNKSRYRNSNIGQKTAPGAVNTKGGS